MLTPRQSHNRRLTRLLKGCHFQHRLMPAISYLFPEVILYQRFEQEILLRHMIAGHCKQATKLKYLYKKA